MGYPSITNRLGNSVFSPSSDEVDQAKLILSALKEAAEAGKRESSLTGR
ncbi:MAG: hypothetical protein CM1200mP30_28470 [Pseudomonadota bacterium]|nr:MAG: hypothetical protein CM1200mP30_28470 [Pseudomonadota bacterium]